MRQAPSGHRAIEGSHRPPAAHARRIRATDPDAEISVIIRVRARPDGPPLPDQDHWMKTPHAGRSYLSHGEFTARHGASPDDIEQVARFAIDHGMRVTGTCLSRRMVFVSGTAAQMSEAFAVDLYEFESPGERYRGREGSLYVPEALADVVVGVFGLDRRRVGRRHVVPAGSMALTVPLVATMYNFPIWLGAVGQKIGLIEFAGPSGAGYQLSDIQAFFDGFTPKLPMPELVNVAVGEARVAPAGSRSNFWNSDPRELQAADPDLEVTADIDVVGAVAQGATLVVYVATMDERGWIDAVATAVHDAKNAISVLSISWGGAERASFTPAGIRSLNRTFQEAAALGITVLCSSGDRGTDCGVGDGRAHVEYPASDPWVTSCGGTIITNVGDGKFDEGTWCDDSGVTGGGVSEIDWPDGEQGSFAVPPWQAGINTAVSLNDGKRRGRGVPDIAGNASGYSGYLITLYGEPTTSLRVTKGPNEGSVQGTIGGTSVVAPLYAGLVALINGKLGTRVGYLNPTLYALAGTPVFRNIHDGAGNGHPFVPSEAQAPARAPGYASAAGWNACTGLGVIDGEALLAALEQSHQGGEAADKHP